jgi:hypothetical protein
MKFIDDAGFWELQDDYRPSHDVLPGGKSISLNPAAALDQPWSTLTVHSGERKKQVSIYPADWDEAPAAYISCRDRLLEIRPQRAREFEPKAFRLEVRRLPSAESIPTRTIWPFPDLVLPAPSGELILTSAQGVAVSEFLREHPPVAFQEGQPFSLRLFGEPPRQP